MTNSAPGDGLEGGADRLNRTAELFGLASNPIRLRLLLALRGTEMDVRTLVDGLRTTEGSLRHHLSALYGAGLVRNRTIGGRKAYALTIRGEQLIELYRSATAPTRPALAQEPPQVVEEPSHDAAPELSIAPKIRVTDLFNRINHPTRLQLLEMLADEPLSSTALAQRLKLDVDAIQRHCDVLVSGNVLQRSRLGRGSRYQATEAGAIAAEYLAALRRCLLEMGRRESSRRATEPKRLIAAIDVLSSPLQFRMLYLLPESGVCSCYIGPTLDAPPERIKRVVGKLKTCGLIDRCRLRGWTHYRPTEFSMAMRRLLDEIVGPRLAERPMLAEDQRLLAGRSTCEAGRRPGVPGRLERPAGRVPRSDVS